MEGLFIADREPSDDNLTLLLARGNLEIIRQRLEAQNMVWLEPHVNKRAVEFFYVVRGALTLELDDGPRRLTEGDSFHIEGLSRDVLLRPEDGTELFYVADTPQYDAMTAFKNDTNRLIDEIDAKDQYTRDHCRHVGAYSIALANRLVGKLDCAISDTAMAALFHDVGKCRWPDEVLKKSGALTMEEFLIVKRHPTDGAEILGGMLSERAVAIVLQHHERLDGSGYPRALAGDEILPEARVLAVADSFDAMTTKRAYNIVKERLAAAEELCDMREKYDARAALALWQMVKSDQLPPI